MSAHGRNHWIKLYVEMNHDPKIGLLTDDLKWRFTSILLLAGEHDDDGFLPEIDEMAWTLRVAPETLAGQLRTLAQRTLVELRQHQGGGERWFVTQFAARQAASTNAERQKQWRKRNATNADNATVTKRYAKVTPETETETETETEGESGAIAPAHPTPPPATFQPVPPAVQKQKERRGDVEPEPAMITNGPPIMRLLAQHTGYWPGADVAPTLVQEFGESPDEPMLARAVELWRASGHKLTNWLGIADWYKQLRQRPDWTPQDRFKNGNGSNGHGKPTPPKSVSTPAPGSQPLTW